MQYHFLHRIQWWVTGALSHYQCEQPHSQGCSVKPTQSDITRNPFSDSIVTV